MAAVEAEAVEAVHVEATPIEERLQELRNTMLTTFVPIIDRMNPIQQRQYYEVSEEIRRLENLQKRQNRPSFMQRVSTYLTRRTTAPIIPVNEEIPVARFTE